MRIHIGEKIKAKAREFKLGTTELGRLINTSKQNIYGIFKRPSIDTEMLFEISKVLKYDFFQFYELPELAKQHEKKSLKEIQDLKKENEKLKSLVKSLTEKNELLKKINDLLDRKNKRK